MQSGYGKNDFWLLEYMPEKQKYVDPLMGWTGSKDMHQQLKLKFDSAEEAAQYAKTNNIPYEIQEPKPRKQIRKSYAENFAYKPISEDSK